VQNAKRKKQSEKSKAQNATLNTQSTARKAQTAKRFSFYKNVFAGERRLHAMQWLVLGLGLGFRGFT
jgi:hypothetical protein